MYQPTKIESELADEATADPAAGQNAPHRSLSLILKEEAKQNVLSACYLWYVTFSLAPPSCHLQGTTRS